METGNLQRSYEKLPGNLNWTSVNWRQNWTSESEEVSRYKTAQKSSQKSDQKVSGHTYARIRNQKYNLRNYSETNEISEVRIF